MERLVELTSPPVVGETYLVPCVEARLRDHMTGVFTQPWELPVFGTIHRDPELGYYAGLDHLHLDQRFVQENYLRVAHGINAKQLGSVPKANAIVNRGFSIPVIQMENAEIIKGPEERPRQCLREAPNLSRTTVNRDGSVSEWTIGGLHGFGRFEDKYGDRKLKDCKVCPHRGIHLGSIPVRNGVITCPGHTLDYDANTGCVVRRTKKSKHSDYFYEFVRPEEIPK